MRSGEQIQRLLVQFNALLQVQELLLLLKSCRKRICKVIEGDGSIGMRGGEQIQRLPVQFNALLQVRELPRLLKSCRKRRSKVIEGSGSFGMRSGSQMERSSQITDGLIQVHQPACSFTQFQRISSLFKQLFGFLIFPHPTLEESERNFHLVDICLLVESPQISCREQ